MALVDARDNVDKQSCKRSVDNGTVEQYEILSIDPNCPRHGKFSRTAWLRKQQEHSLEVKPVLSAEAGLSSTDQQIVLRPNDHQLYSEAPPSEATAVTGIDNLIHETGEDENPTSGPELISVYCNVQDEMPSISHIRKQIGVM